MEKKNFKRIKKYFFTSIFLFLLFFFVFYSYNAYTFESQTVWWDESVYISLAKNFLEEKSLVLHVNKILNENVEAFRSPFFPSVIVILLFLFGSVKAVYFFNFIIMILFLILMFLFFKNKDNIFLSLTTIIIFLSINTVFITTKALAEPLELFFTILFFYILFFKRKYEFFIPLILVFSFLTKYSLIILTFTYFFYLILEYFFYFKNKSFLQYILQKFDFKYSFFTILSLSILLLWFYHNYYFYKDIFGALKENSMIVNYDFKKTPYWYYFVILLENTKMFFYTTILGLLFFLKDTFSSKEKKTKLYNYTILFFTITFFLSVSFVYEKNYRYLFPIIIFYSYFSSYFIISILKIIKKFLKKILRIKCDEEKNVKIKKIKSNSKDKDYKKRFLVLFIIMFLLQIFVIIVLSYYFYDNFSYNITHAYNDKQDNYKFRIVAEFLKNNTNTNERLMSLYRQPWFYYTDRSVVWYPEYANALPEMISKYNVKYILLEENVVPQLSWSESFLERHNYSLPVYNETYGDYYFKKVLEEHSNKTNTTIKVYQTFKVNVFG